MPPINTEQQGEVQAQGLMEFQAILEAAHPMGVELQGLAMVTQTPWVGRSKGTLHPTWIWILISSATPTLRHIHTIWANVPGKVVEMRPG